MAVEKIFILPGGFVDIDRSLFLSAVDMGRMITAPVYSVLLITSDGPILIDLGFNPDGVLDPERAWGPRAKLIRPQVKKEDDVRLRLKEVDLEVTDVKMVILTHMHWDHTGALRFFKHCPVVVQRDEHRFAFSPDLYLEPLYMPNHLDPALDYRLLEGDTVVADGVSVVKTPGHTPGHQSVLVRKSDGKHYIFAGDAVPLMENMERKIPLSNTCSAKQCMDSLYRIEHLAEIVGAKIVPSHDMVAYENLKKCPEAL
jgi:N-acyl homoserine lactone hydrolase